MKTIYLSTTYSVSSFSGCERTSAVIPEFSDSRLKTALLNLICFAIAYPMTFVKSVWLPLTVYCMLMTFHKDESKRAASRIWGTIFGLAVYALFTEFLPGDARIKSIVIMFAAFSLMFTLPTKP